MSMTSIICVGVGGAIGSLARYGVTHLFSGAFPYGTLAVNITGSLLMGLWVGCMGAFSQAAQANTHLFLAIGVLGGYTTFSTFSLDVFRLMERGQPMLAAGYMLASVALSVAALAAGVWFGRGATL